MSFRPRTPTTKAKVWLESFLGTPDLGLFPGIFFPPSMWVKNRKVLEEKNSHPENPGEITKVKEESSPRLPALGHACVPFFSPDMGGSPRRTNDTSKTQGWKSRGRLPFDLCSCSWVFRFGRLLLWEICFPMYRNFEKTRKKKELPLKPRQQTPLNEAKPPLERQGWWTSIREESFSNFFVFV